MRPGQERNIRKWRAGIKVQPGQIVKHDGCLWMMDADRNPHTSYIMDEPGVGYSSKSWLCIDPRPLSETRIPPVIDRKFRKKWTDRLLAWKVRDIEFHSARYRSRNLDAVPWPSNWNEQSNAMFRLTYYLGLDIHIVGDMAKKRRERSRSKVLERLNAKGRGEG